MERKIIHQNTELIDGTIKAYKTALPVIQAAMDSLTAEGISLDDTSFADLFAYGADTKASVERQIREEVSRFKFLISKTDHEKKLWPLKSKIDEAVQAITKVKSQTVSNNVFICKVENFVSKNLQILARSRPDPESNRRKHALRRPGRDCNGGSATG